jgi:hypothetical protein
VSALNLDTSTKFRAAVAQAPAGPDGKLGCIMRVRTVTVSIIATAVMCVLAATPAQATTTGGCEPSSLSQPFLPWHDVSHYRLAPGGDFEGESSIWSLGGGAHLASGNEPFMVHSDQDAQALRLGEYGSATSPSVCLAIEDPTLRFFARNAGSPSSTLLVSVNYTDVFGEPQSLPLTLVASGDEWRPTLQIPVVFNLLSLPLVTDGSTDVSFGFTPLGSGGDWTIDDVYVDPFKTK